MLMRRAKRLHRCVYMEDELRRNRLRCVARGALHAMTPIRGRREPFCGRRFSQKLDGGANKVEDEVVERGSLRWSSALSKAKSATLLLPRFQPLSLFPCAHPNANQQPLFAPNFQIESSSKRLTPSLIVDDEANNAISA